MRSSLAWQVFGVVSDLISYNSGSSGRTFYENPTIIGGSKAWQEPTPIQVLRIDGNIGIATKRLLYEYGGERTTRFDSPRWNPIQARPANREMNSMILGEVYFCQTK